MRPDILNPLFAEVTALKGVGAVLAKPLERLKLARVVDVAFHLPTAWVDRLAREELFQADVGRIVAIIGVSHSTGQGIDPIAQPMMSTSCSSSSASNQSRSAADQRA